MYDPHASERDVHPAGKPVHHARAAAQRIGGGRRRRARRRRASAVSSRARGWRAGRVRSPATSGPARDARTRMAGSWRCSFWLRCWLLPSGARVDREIHLCPGGELGRLPACYLVCERNFGRASPSPGRYELGSSANIATISAAPGKDAAKTSFGTCLNENSCPCRFSVSTISLKLMKSPTSGRYCPLPA